METRLLLLASLVRVVACDDDLSRLKLAANNAAIYGVSHAIDFVQGDTLASFKKNGALTRRIGVLRMNTI